MSKGVCLYTLYMSKLRGCMRVVWLFMVVLWFDDGLLVVCFKLQMILYCVNGGNLVYFDFVQICFLFFCANIFYCIVFWYCFVMFFVCFLLCCNVYA